jgi:hypothetical protein
MGMMTGMVGTLKTAQVFHFLHRKVKYICHALHQKGGFKEGFLEEACLEPKRWFQGSLS